MRHFNIVSARKAYADGKNVTELLRQQKGVSFNTPEIIETSYDLQAGTYIECVRGNIEHATHYASELASILDGHIISGQVSARRRDGRIDHAEPPRATACKQAWTNARV